MTETIRLATRGSQLALRQARHVAEILETRRRSTELVEVETTGDAVRDELIHRLGKTGAFVRSLDEKVLDGDVDAAVHSMKDMPTDFPDGLVVAGVPERATAIDVLVTPEGATLGDLPEGATVGTSSLRRKAQLLASRPDLAVEPLRGNVDTRVQKLLAPSLRAERERRIEAAEAPEDEDEDENENGEAEPTYDRTPEEWLADLSDLERGALEREPGTEFDAIALAEAGLVRIGLAETVPYREFPRPFLSAPGQGALAVTARNGGLAESLSDALDHPRSRVETTVERTILGALGGGCVAPIGIYAVVQGEHVQTRVRVLSQDGTEEIEATRDLPIETHPEAAREFASDLDARGAGELIRRARREA